MRPLGFGVFLIILVACQSGPPPYQSLEPYQNTTSYSNPNEILQALGFQENQVGFLVVKESTGEIVHQSNARKPFIPASVNKIPTSLAALSILGSNFRYQTALKYTGSIRKGTLKGDLYLEGGGDPVLQMEHLMNLAMGLRNRGIKRVEGKFLVDDSRYQKRDQLSSQFNPTATYNPAISSLSLAFNRFFFSWNRSGDGSKLQYAITPFQVGGAYNLDPKAKKFQYAKSSQWLVPGGLSAKGVKGLPCKDPARLAANIFREFATQNGIAISEPKGGRAPRKARTLAKHLSPPLIRIVESLLEYSNNLIGASLVLESSRKLSGKSKSLERSSEHVSSWLRKHIGRASWKGFSMDTGSGLSTKGKLSPQQTVAMLRWAMRRRFSGREFMTLLPISGWKGSFGRSLDASDIALRVWAKTGTLDFVAALAGYFFNQNHEKFIFAIYVNDQEKRAYADANPESEDKNAGASDWRKKSRRLQMELLRSWIVS